MNVERKWAVITAGVVENTVVADRDLHATHGGDAWIEITGMDPEPQINWSYNNGVFAPPNGD